MDLFAELNNHLEYTYILALIFSGMLIRRLFEHKIKMPFVYFILIWAAILAVGFYFLDGSNEGQWYDLAGNYILSYFAATSLYEVFVKKIESAITK
jgi:hypothetical protein